MLGETNQPLRNVLEETYDQISNGNTHVRKLLGRGKTKYKACVEMGQPELCGELLKSKLKAFEMIWAQAGLF